MIKVGIVGGTGYTGVELLRLLVVHPDVEILAVTSRSGAGSAVADVYPNLRGFLSLPFSEPTVGNLSQCDIVFFATPNGVAMDMAPQLIECGVKVIDLAADFRLQDPAVSEQWYGKSHSCVDLLEEAVYGLPEVNRERIKAARVVANPGCYPTAVELAFLPLLEKGLIDTSMLIADAKSGVSGAGRQASVGSLLCEVSESFKAYGMSGHRHLPEITQELNRQAKTPVNLTFIPHLTPMIRGIHATCYGQLTGEISSGADADLQELFEQRYENEPFIDVMPVGSAPETRSVKGSNICRIAVHRPQGGRTVVILSVIDNLVKGAAGQAVHNMNLMCNLDEKAGLGQVPMMP